MQNLATGGSVFVHNVEEKDISGIKSKQPRFNIAIFIAAIVPAMILIASMNSFMWKKLPHLPLWVSEQANKVDYTTGYSYANMKNADYGIMFWTGGMIIVVAATITLISGTFKLKKWRFYPLIGVGLFLAMYIFSPFTWQTVEATKVPIPEWAEARYGVILPSDTVSFGLSTDKEFNEKSGVIVRDTKNNLMIARQDPTRQDQVFLYQADGETELSLTKNAIK